MKNNLLLSVIAVLVAALALTSCEQPSNVTEVCTDMVKQSMHKSARSLAQFDSTALTLAFYEYEFLGGVDDNRLAYRTIGFGHGFDQPKKWIHSLMSMASGEKEILLSRCMSLLLQENHTPCGMKAMPLLLLMVRKSVETE